MADNEATPPPLTETEKKEYVQRWRSSKFLGDGSDGEYDISLRDFVNYTRHDVPVDISFFNNNMVDSSLELLRRKFLEKKFKNATIVDTFHGTMLYLMEKGRKTNGKWADKPDLNPYGLDDELPPGGRLKGYLSKLMEKTRCLKIGISIKESTLSFTKI